MRALEQIVESGKARFVGVSNYTLDMLRACAQERRVDVIQVGYHMFDRRMEQEIFPWAIENGVGVMGYGSLGHGLLTGAFKPDHEFEENDWRGQGAVFGQRLLQGENFNRNVAVVERLKQEVAEPRGVPISQVALAWVLRHPALSTALVGARNPGEVEANVAGTELELADDELAKIEEILRGVSGRVMEFTPLQPAMVQWGPELPPEAEVASA
jgi:aryl-alcohol dehydrogenase-like predicted oxidoreductase